MRRGLRPRRDLLRLVGLQDLLPVLSGADADRLLDRDDEDLAVAHVSGPRVSEDRLDDRGQVPVVDHDLELELRPQVDGQLRAAIVLRDALLPARALVLGDREAGESLVEQLHADRLERLVSDERLYLLHAVTSSGRGVVLVAGTVGVAAGEAAGPVDA